MLDVVPVLDMLTLSHVCKEWREFIDGDMYAHWKRKWRLQFGSHENISNESDYYQNPKHLCVSVAKDERYFYKKFMRLNIKTKSNRLQRKRLLSAYRMKKKFLKLVKRKMKKEHVAQFASQLDDGRLILFKYVLEGTIEGCYCLQLRIDLYPLSIDPMTPLKIQCEFDIGGMAGLHVSHVIANYVGMIFSVHNDERSARYYDEQKALTLCEIIMNEETEVENMQWVLSFTDIDGDFFTTEIDFPETVNNDDNFADWHDDNMLGSVRDDYEIQIYADEEEDDED